MIRIGKSYQNLMVDVKATNEKLVARAARIVIQATDCSEAQAKQVLVQTDYDVKLAILMLLTGLNKQQAQNQLKQHKGFLRSAAEAS